MREQAVERLLAGVAGGAEDGGGGHHVRIMHKRWNLCTTHPALVLEDGTVFPGSSVGAPGVAAGEACFTTAMTGYEEAVTDPSYVAQVLCFAYPLIGTYGVDEARMESDRVQCEGVVMRDVRPEFAAWLREQGVVALTGVDTRTLVRKIRDGGVLRCALGDAPVEELHARALAEPPIDGRPLDRQVGATEPYSVGAGPRVVVVDLGSKRSIPRRLADAGLEAYVVPGCVGRGRDPRGRAARGADRERPRRPGGARPTRSRRSARCSAGCRSSASASATSCSGSRSATRPSSSRSATAARTIRCATSRTGRVLVTVQNHGFAVLGERRHLARLAERRHLRGPAPATASRASSSIPRRRRARSTPSPSSTASPSACRSAPTFARS